MRWLVTPQRFLKPCKVRLVFLFLAVVAFGITEVGRHICRPYVRASGIDDFGLTDSIGNLGGIIVQIFFSAAILNPTRRQSYRLAAFLSVGYIVYEFVQPLLPKGVFDWNDVFGTVIGFCLSVIILWLIWRASSVPEECSSSQNPSTRRMPDSSFNPLVYDRHSDQAS